MSPDASMSECMRTFDSGLSKCWSGMEGWPVVPSAFWRPVSCHPYSSCQT